jgi:hypothetical protein
MGGFAKKAFAAVFHFVGPFRDPNVRLVRINAVFEGESLHVLMYSRAVGSTSEGWGEN